MYKEFSRFWHQPTADFVAVFLPLHHTSDVSDAIFSRQRLQIATIYNNIFSPLNPHEEGLWMPACSGRKWELCFILLSVACTKHENLTPPRQQNVKKRSQKRSLKMLQLERKTAMKQRFLPFCAVVFRFFRGQSIAFMLQKQPFYKLPK